MLAEENFIDIKQGTNTGRENLYALYLNRDNTWFMGELHACPIDGALYIAKSNVIRCSSTSATVEFGGHRLASVHWGKIHTRLNDEERRYEQVRRRENAYIYQIGQHVLRLQVKDIYLDNKEIVED